MKHNEAEYNQMLSDQCQYEAEADERAMQMITAERIKAHKDARLG